MALVSRRAVLARLAHGSTPIDRLKGGTIAQGLMLGCAQRRLRLPAPPWRDGDAANGREGVQALCGLSCRRQPTNRSGRICCGVVGRTAGTVEGFKYSEPMIARQGWRLERCQTLDKYLEIPKGSSQEQDGLPRAEEARGARRRHRLPGAGERPAAASSARRSPRRARALPPRVRGAAGQRPRPSRCGRAPARSG